MVVLQQGEHSSVNNRPAGEEVTGTRKKGETEMLEKMKRREVKVQFKREPLIIFHGPDLRRRPFYVMVIQMG